ncbi:TonB-dependent siderophore receptor [Azotobacter vinelandii]
MPYPLRRFSLKQRLGARFRPLLLASAIGCVLAEIPSVQAQQETTAEQQRNWNIPAQSLSAALVNWSQVSGVQLFADTELTRNLVSTAVSGRYDAAEALTLLLSGTGLSAHFLAPDRVTLVKSVEQQDTSSALELEPTAVTSVALSPTTENTGSYASPAVSIGKGNKSIKDIPQSVSVITQQRMQDQDITSVSEALVNSPGITAVPSFGMGTQFYSRGFFINNFQYDGVPLERQSYARGSSFTGETAIYDRVEVLRGAQGLLEGAGDPSGSVNLVRKRPTPINQVNLTAKAGSWDRYGLQADIAGPIDNQGRLRGRLVLDYDIADSFVDYVNEDNQTLYVALDYDLTELTQIGLGYSRERIDARPNVNGIPNYTDGSITRFGRSTYLGTKWDYRDKIQDAYYLDLTHHLSSDWTLKASIINAREQNDYKYLLRAGMLNKDSSTLRGDAYVFDFFSDHWGGDVYVTGRTQLLGRELGLTIGANYSELESNDSFGWLSNYAPGLDIFNFTPDDNEPSDGSIYAGSRWDDGYDSIQRGIYSSAQYEITDSISIVLGGRLTSFHRTYFSDGPWGYSKTTAKKTDEFTPYAGLIYKLNSEWSAYASYTDIFVPQTSRTADGSLLDPKTGKSVEVGLKGVLHDGRLIATFALYKMEQDNIAIRDDSAPAAIQNANCGGTCYRGSGTVESRGFESEISGEITDNLQIYAAYTLNLLKYKDEEPATAANITANTGTPKHILRTWLNYKLPGEWEKVSIGGGVNAQSWSSGFGYYDRVQSGYAVWNSRIAYQFNRNLSASLNIDNMFDKRYYSSVDYDKNHFGNPRSFLLTLRYNN